MAYSGNHSLDSFGAVHPAHQAEDLLLSAQRELMAQKKRGKPYIDDIMSDLYDTAGIIASTGGLDPADPASLKAVNRAMNQLRDVLGTLQTIALNDPALESVTRLIAKTLALLYPLSKFGESRAPSTPAPMEPPSLFSDRRQTRRMCVEAEIGFQSDTNFFVGFSEDISTGGIFVTTYDTQPLGSPLNVNFTLPGGHLISADGVVRWVREYNVSTPDTPPGMGVQFENLSPQDKEAIEMFVNQRPAMFYEA